MSVNNASARRRCTNASLPGAEVASALAKLAMVPNNTGHSTFSRYVVANRRHRGPLPKKRRFSHGPNLPPPSPRAYRRPVPPRSTRNRPGRTCPYRVYQNDHAGTFAQIMLKRRAKRILKRVRYARISQAHKQGPGCPVQTLDRKCLIHRIGRSAFPVALVRPRRPPPLLIIAVVRQSWACFTLTHRQERE